VREVLKELYGNQVDENHHVDYGTVEVTMGIVLCSSVSIGSQSSFFV